MKRNIGGIERIVAFFVHWVIWLLAFGQAGAGAGELKPHSFATCGVLWKRRGAIRHCFIGSTLICGPRTKSNCTIYL